MLYRETLSYIKGKEGGREKEKKNEKIHKKILIQFRHFLKSFHIQLSNHSISRMMRDLQTTQVNI